MQDLKKNSPFGIYAGHCRKGELAYQVGDDGKPVFYPRVVAPGTGSDRLEWRVSKGSGTVYATTVVHYRDEPPLNVALIDLDEGFRMMSRVESLDPMRVTIGMRVEVRMHAGEGKQPPFPVFVPILTPEPSPQIGRGSSSERAESGAGSGAPFSSGKKGKGRRMAGNAK
jgi:uncharacterized protein